MGWALALTTSAAAAPCPRPTLSGPDPALVRAVEAHLHTVDTSTATCEPVRVEVRRGPRGIEVTLLDAGDARVVKRPATAASLAASWAAPALEVALPSFPPRRASGSGVDARAATGTSTGTSTRTAGGSPARAAAPAPRPGASRDAPEPPPSAAEGLASLTPLGPGGSGPAEPEAPPPGPRAAAKASSRGGAAAAAPPAELSAGASTLPQAPAEGGPWAAGLAVAGAGGGLGAGVAAGWELSAGRWRLAPTLRAHYDRQPDGDARAGAHGYELGLGASAGYELLGGAWSLQPRAGLFAAYRAVDPSQPVGLIACQPLAPCRVGDPVADDVGAYHAFAAWAELGARLVWWVSEHFGVGAGAAFALTPGFATVGGPGAPLTLSFGPAVRVREQPVLPRWRASSQVSLHWRSP